MGCLGVIFDHFCNEFEPLLVHPEAHLGHLGVIMGPSRGHLGPSWGHLGAIFGAFDEEERGEQI